jgi:hypothetical protein
MMFSLIFQRQVKKKIHQVILEEVNWWVEPNRYQIQKWKFIIQLAIIPMLHMFRKMPQQKYNKIALFMKVKISNIVSTKNSIISLPLLLSQHYPQEKNSMQLGSSQIGRLNQFHGSLKTGGSHQLVKLEIQWAIRCLMFKEPNLAM